MSRLRSTKKATSASADSAEAADAQTTQGRPAPSKAEIVREAVASGLGAPGDIVDYAQKRYGVTLSKPMASSYKAQHKAREGRTAGGRARPGRKPASAATGGRADVLTALEDLKPLVKQYGGDTLKRLIDVLE